MVPSSGVVMFRICTGADFVLVGGEKPERSARAVNMSSASEAEAFRAFSCRCGSKSFTTVRDCFLRERIACSGSSSGISNSSKGEVGEATIVSVGAAREESAAGRAARIACAAEDPREGDSPALSPALSPSVCLIVLFMFVSSIDGYSIRKVCWNVYLTNKHTYLKNGSQIIREGY